MESGKYRIVRVKTIIFNKIQRVLLKLEGKDNPVDIPFEGVTKMFPESDIRTVEFLVDSYFILVQSNSEASSSKWAIELQGEFNDCVERNKKLYRKFQKINHIIPAKIDQHPSSFLIEGFEYSFFMPMEIFLRHTGLEFNDYKLIQGSYMTCETWNEGEWAGDNDEFDDPVDPGFTRKVRKSGTILKYPVFRTPNDLLTTSNKHKVVLFGGEKNKQPFIFRRSRK